MRREMFLETWDGVVGWFESMVRKIRRTTAGPVLARSAVTTAALVAELVVLPPSVALSAAGFLGCVTIALGAGLAPRSRWVTMVALLTVAGWLFTTLAHGGELVLWRLVTVTAGLYVMHTGAALAAVLPYDAVVSPGVLVTWLVRTATVLVASLAVGLITLIISTRLHAVSALAAPIIGVAAVAGLTLLLAHRLRRR
jgi:hypothetical protein